MTTPQFDSVEHSLNADDSPPHDFEPEDEEGESVPLTATARASAPGKVSRQGVRGPFRRGGLFRRPVRDERGPPLSTSVLEESRKTSIIMAIIMFLAGSIFLLIAILLLTGYIETKYWDRGYSLLVIGALLFIPGFYHTRIAYLAWKGRRGYHINQIPVW